ncbi:MULTISPECIES: zf-HC2 domain-containing protein [unclassified Streptomyces]|uniref:zf-HC2 domain-containing protein n=1 Tax=unclassified Streptomyces TaxID=2593676 RepID=UPI002E2C4D1D|nr:zf-HC2 domain-containing protein [Streptomyces sp. NBC_01429]
MSVEHASARIIDAYARGDTELAADEEWALEAHLEACGVCRGRLATAVTARAPAVTSLLDTVWSGLEPHLATAPVPRTRRRAWLPVWAPPATVPWLAMVVGVTLLAVLMDPAVSWSVGSVFTTVPVSPVLLAAPLLPVLGVAASWSRGLDPGWELTASAPRAGLDLVLRRTACVLAVVIPALLVAGWLTGVMVAQWLLPCLAFTSATLALGGAVGVSRAAAALTVAWVAVGVAPSLAGDGLTFALRTDVLPLWGLLLALGTGVVVARRGAYSVLEAHR